jgi:glycosyltransferase involved in cell wall biosynthesis
MISDTLLKVSIITTCFNGVATIEQTILSVLHQTYPNIEYIIIDGGSTDGTLEVIRKYEPQISYWISEKDGGISEGWNKGLAKATSQIIGIINSDDWYAEDAVQQIVNQFGEHPEAGFIFGDLMYIDPYGNSLFIQKGDPNYFKEIAYQMPSIPHPTVFVSSDIYKSCGSFNRNYKIAMDYEFLLRITKNGVKGSYVPKILAYMRFGGKSDILNYKGFREVMNASIGFGYNKLYARVRYYYKCLKFFMRKSLQKLKLEPIVRWYHTCFNRHYKYDSGAESRF